MLSIALNHQQLLNNKLIVYLLKTNLKFYRNYYLLWIAHFLLAKFLFLGYHFDKTVLLSPKTIALIIVHGLKMDLSFAAYLSVLPALLLSLFGCLDTENKLVKIVRVYTYIIIFFSSILICVDLQLYTAWGYRLDATPLMYLSHPIEMIGSASSSPWQMLVFSFVVLVFITKYLFDTYCFTIPYQSRTYKIAPLFRLALTGFLIIPIRGGLQIAPINQSSVYFSTDLYANQAAINTDWNFFDSLVNQTANQANPYQYLSQKEVANEIDSLFKDKGTTTTILKNGITKPNVLIITWESLTYKLMFRHEQGKAILPELEQLTTESIFFSQCYASGDRSDKGLVAILSGYPAQPTKSIMTMPKKTVKLPVLSQDFAKNGYSTSWYYGGEPEFANIKSYMLQGQMQHFINKDSFEEKDMNSKWGAHDHVVFNRILTDLKTVKSPFFINFFTLSSHEPFEIPVQKTFEGDTEEQLFFNAHHYTDQSLGNFIRSAKKQTWWNNTIVIIIADHGHRIPESSNKIADFHIPMLWTGGAINPAYFGENNNICSQDDLANSLLTQLHIPNNQYTWSKNIFSTAYQPFAYFAFNDGFGVLNSKGWLTYDNQGKHVIQERGNNQLATLKTGKAFLQHAYEDFLKK